MGSYFPLCPTPCSPPWFLPPPPKSVSSPLQYPQYPWAWLAKSRPVLLLVSSYTCTYWSGNVCLPIRWAEGVSVRLQNDVPCGLLPSNAVSGVKAFQFSLSSAKSLSQCGVSLNLQALHVFEIFNSLLNWVVIGWQVTVSLICLWEKQGLSFWNWY